MTTTNVPSVGDTIRTWRRRRQLSQRAVAELAGMSQGHFSKIESGQVPLDRRSTQLAVAAALKISVAELLGDPGIPADPLKDRALSSVPEIRAALVEVGAGERRHPTLSADDVRAQVADLTEARNAADYATVAPMLPGLVYELAAHGPDLTPELISVLFAARYALRTMGLVDLGREAAEIGRRRAENFDSPAWRGQAVYNWVQSLPAESADLGHRIAARTADSLQGVPDRDAQEIYGCLHILAGFEAAVAGDALQAAAHLDEAADVAEHLGEPARTAPLSAGINGNWFGPTQVQVWRVAVAAELRDTAAAEAINSTIDLTKLPVPNRHTYYHFDRARALVAGGEDLAAVRALAAAERAAPQHFRLNPVARNIVDTVATRIRRRAIGPELARLAHSVGVPA